jgi:hypothetical protein
MKTLLKSVTLSALTATLALASGVGLAQSTSQTPLSEPLDVSGSVTPTRQSSCGFLPDTPVQNLQVSQEFASVEITARGDSGMTLYIEGDNGFTECHRTNAASGNTISAPGLLNRGNYSFYIGNTSQGTTNYTLTIEQN